MILRLGFQRAGGDGGHHLAQYPCTHGGHAVKQLAAGLLRVNGDLFAAEHVAGVKALVHLHDGNAGLGIAVQHGPLHRALPRYLGSRETCRLMQPYFGVSSTDFGRMQP